MSDPTPTWTQPVYDEPAPEPLPERRVKVGHLVTGLVFLGLAGGWALHSGGALGDVAVGLVIPVVLVVAGLVGLVVALVGNRRRARAAAAPTYDSYDTYDPPTDGPLTEPTAPLSGLGATYDTPIDPPIDPEHDEKKEQQ